MWSLIVINNNYKLMECNQYFSKLMSTKIKTEMIDIDR